MFVYHIVPPNFTGDELYPLNALRDALPSIYDYHASKYRGRDELLERRIPYLNCRWNDTLHFSPVPPERLRDALKDAGFPWQQREWFEMDPEMLGFSGQNAVIYTHPVRPQGGVSDDDFLPFTVDLARRLDAIPKATSDYFTYAKAHDERPFLFNFVPHILYHGPLNVNQDGVRVITV
jgi:hypothetical protein